MEDSRRFFRAEVEVKNCFRMISKEEVSSIAYSIDAGIHEDLYRTYVAGEEKFLKTVDHLGADKEDLKSLILFINEKVNFALKSSPNVKDHPLNTLPVEIINLGGGGCALYQDFPVEPEKHAFIEFILLNNSRYIRAILKSLHSAPAGNKWKNGYIFEKITVEDQDALMGYLFQCQRSEQVVGQQAHQSAKDGTPYN